MSIRTRDNSGVLQTVAGMANVDAVLSPTSKNAIMNKSVYAALYQKIDKTVNDLVNYYTTDQTYTKKEVRDLIGAINTLTMEVVNALPTSDISATTIYLLQTGPNAYDEYIYVNNAWVKIGNTEIDLSDFVKTEDLTLALQSYYTKAQTDALFNDYYDKDDVDDLLDLKQDKLEFDDEPTTGSANPVTSTGIKSAINNAIVSSAGGSIIKVHHLAGSAAKGDTVTASKGSYSVSATFDNSGNATIIGFGEIGNVTITATNGSESGTKEIYIECFSSYSTIIDYGLDYKSWLIAGGMNPSYYSSLNQVLADEEAVRRLMTVHASVDYLTNVNSEDDEMISIIINNDICAKWINLRDYALDTLSANVIISNLMDTADKYGYGEWALLPQVPTLTSNTAPYGEAFCQSNYSGMQAYKAFDGDDTTQWSSASANYNAWVGYKFPNPVCITRVKLKNSAESTPTDRYKGLTIEGSYDGAEWEVIADIYDKYDAISADIDFENDKSYQYYRVHQIDESARVHFSTVQFYAWGPKGNVPVMTSNTVPYGEVIFSTVYSSFYAYNAFNPNTTSCWMAQATTNDQWVGYKFVNPIKVMQFAVSSTILNGASTATDRLKKFKIQASNNNSTWVDVTEEITYTGTVINSTTGKCSVQTGKITKNSGYYTFYRIIVTDRGRTDWYAGIGSLQLFGREMSVSVPRMFSNTDPYCTIVPSSEYNSSGLHAAWHAFDGDSAQSISTCWASTTTNATLKVIFPVARDIKRFRLISPASANSNEIKQFKIQYSLDNNVWQDATSTITHITASPSELTDKLYEVNGEPTKYWRVLAINNIGNNSIIRICECNFYGFDYSERDWDTIRPRHYIYDHGIELEELTTRTGIVDKGLQSIYVGSTGATYGFINTQLINMDGYTDMISHCLRYIGNGSYHPCEGVFSTVLSTYDSTVRLTTASYRNSLNSRYICATVSSITNSASLGLYSEGNSSGNYSYSEIDEWWLE